MKALRYVLPLMALWALVACQKEKTAQPEETGSQEETFPIEFVSERPQTEDGTRTHWDGQTILWDQADWIRMGYTVGGVWQNGTGNASGDAKLYGSQGTTLTEEGAVASFTTNVNFNGTTQGPHVFYAVYPGSATGATMTTAPTATVTVPMTQTPLANSFDPAADLMLGHSIDTYNERPTTPVRLVWNRVVAHGQITLKNLPETVSGEKVNTITLTAQPGANLTGAQEMDITTGAFTPASDNTTANQVIIQGDNLTIDSNGNVSFWMAILPANLTGLVVKVETDKAVYTRSVTSFSREFLANRRNILPINMGSAVRVSDKPSSGDFYTLVTDDSQLGEGHYLITYVVGDKANVLSGKASGANYGVYASGIDVTDDAIAYDDAGAYDVEIKQTANGYSLKLGTQYLGYTITSLTGSNYLYFNQTFTASKYEWTLSRDEHGDAVITNVYNAVRVLQWNANSNQERFACYPGTQKNVQLFKWTGPAVPKVTTRPATDITVSSAVLNAGFAHLGTNNVQDVHFLWGTSADQLTEILEVGDDFEVSSGEFHVTLSSLDENTTYYYKAVLQYCTEGMSYQVLEGNVGSFKTLSSASGGNAGLQWLGCYEMPAIDLVNQNSYSGRGTETFGATKWYNYKTTNSMQKVVTHTYAYQGKTYRNYTTLVDGNKRCPLWTAYVMHNDVYPNNGVDRGSFNTKTSYDPGISKSWQSSGSTTNGSGGSSGYSRGHHIASSDRRVNDDSNDQTFYYTNQSPQWQNGFNSGVWSSLETAIQNHAPTGRDTLYVVVGTLFENGATGPSNDGGTVARPSHFYKLIMKCSFNASNTMTAARGIAFLYTNEAHTGNYYDAGYVTSIDAIEARTGFDFFANIPPNLQNPAEQMTSLLW